MAGGFTSGRRTAIAASAFVDLVGTLSTILRFADKSKKNDLIHKDDVCIVIGWVHWAFRLGHDSQQDFAADFKNWLLVNYIIEPFYTLSVGFTKFSIIFMYFRLFGTLKWMQISCRFTLALVGLWTVACVIIGLIQCIPVRKAWDITIEGGCVDISIFFICQRATNLVTDLILPALPIKVVLGLNASIAKRLSLVFGFCMGGLVCIATAYTLALTVAIIGREISYDDYRSLLWTVVELEIGILCANMPTCYAFVVRMIPDSWKEKVAGRVETIAHTRGFRQRGRYAAEHDTGYGPRCNSKGVLSWVKGGATTAESKTYPLGDVDRTSTNSDVEILRDHNQIYVRQEIEVVDGYSQQGQ